MPTKRNIFYVAALGVALFAIGAAQPQWKGVSIQVGTGVPPTSSVHSIIFPGTATALRFEGDGSGLAGIPGFGVTNDLASKADVAGATSSLAAALGTYPSTNRTAYADPSFPLYSPPYFGNIQSALVWLGSSHFPDGTHTNHGVLKISGQWAVGGSRLSMTSDKYDWLEIDAENALIDCNIGGLGDVQGWLQFGSGVDRVQIKNGKWKAWQDSNKNAQIVRIEGKYGRISGVDAWTAGSNWNLTAAFRLDGINASVSGSRFSIAPGNKGSGAYLPLQLAGATSLVAGCTFDLWEKPNSYFHHDNKPHHQYIGCVFRFYCYGGNSNPLFQVLGEGDRWEHCTFANVVNPAFNVTGHVAVVAPVGGAAEWVSGTGYTGGYDNEGNPEAYYQALRVYPFRTNALGVVNCSTNAPMLIETYSPTDYSSYDIQWTWTNGFNSAWTNTHGWRLVRYDSEHSWDWNQYRDIGRDTTNLLDDATGWIAGGVAYNWTTNYIWSTNAPTWVMNRTVDNNRTIFVVNSVFNQENWYTNCTPVTNFVAIVTNYTGITLPPPE